MKPINWSILLEVMGEPLAPEIHFAEEIETEVMRMERIIHQMQSRRAKGQRLLVSFSPESGFPEEYTHHQALLDVFTHHGVIDAYFDPEAYGYGYRRVGADGAGYDTMSLRVPGSEAEFSVLFFERSNSTKVNFSARP